MFQVTGSNVNEVFAVDVIVSRIESIRKESLFPIEIDVQKTDGAFGLEFGDGMTFR